MPHPDCSPPFVPAPPAARFAGRAVSRRGVVAAGLVGLGLFGPTTSRAQSDSGLTRAGRWVEAEEVGAATAEAVGDTAPEPIVFATPWPATAIAPHWSGKERPGATIEVATSADGERWGEPMVVGEDGDSGRPGKDGRRYGSLVVTGNAAFVRYRSFDADGTPAALRGLAWEIIDVTAGSGSMDTAQEAAASPVAGDPSYIDRAAWGADESLRFQDGREIWTPEYAAVAHAIVHHSDTANFEDPLVAIRSIYYYHAVTRGWGDIGYNALVDYRGNVYEGRAGGDGVVGGHAYGYNVGTAGICTIGRFHGEEPTPEMRQGLVAAVGWATRGLDPFGQTPLADIAGLPTICAHRDVNPTSCPGDALYDDLAWLRDEVANANAGTRDVGVQRFAAGDGVATTAEGVALREAPGTAATTVATIAVGERLAVADGPVAADGFAWYLVEGVSLSGWAAADYLTAITPTGDPEIAVGGTSPADPSELSRWASLPEGATAEVTGGDLLLRDAPAGGVVETLPDGAWVAVIGAPEERSGTLWYPVDTGFGSVGWVSGDYLSPA